MSVPAAVASFDFTRQQWASLGPGTAGGVSGTGALPAAGAASPVPDDEVIEVYLPLCGLLAELAAARVAGTRQVLAHLGVEGGDPPFVVGVAGGVAVGKSTVAAMLGSLLAHWPELAPVEVIATDAFLYPNRELEARGLTARKGFPESYDWDRLLTTLAAVRAGAEEVTVPVYSHQDYDIVPGAHRSIIRPSTLVVEGINVLQISRATGSDPDGADPDGAVPDGAVSDGCVPVSDFLDWSIYVDAAEQDAARWHIDRLLGLRRAAGDHPSGFLAWFCSLDDGEAENVARQSWSHINAVNLREHILPTRARASMVVDKGPDHRVRRVSVRIP